MYVQEGAVKLSVVSRSGQEAVVAMLEPGAFFGESALVGDPVRHETATAMTATTVLVIPNEQMTRLLHEQHEFADHFIVGTTRSHVNFFMNKFKKLGYLRDERVGTRPSKTG